MTSQKFFKKKKKSNHFKLIFSIGIAVLMVLSIFGIYLSNPDQKNSRTLKYGDYKFKVKDNVLTYNYGSNDLVFYNDPNTLKFDFNYSGNLIISFDPNLKDIQYFEIGRKTMNDNFNILGKNVEFGVTNYNSQYAIFPHYDCNSDVNGTLLIIKNGKNETLTKEDNCYVFETYGGKSYLRLMDYISFKKLGVYDES